MCVCVTGDNRGGGTVLTCLSYKAIHVASWLGVNKIEHITLSVFCANQPGLDTYRALVIPLGTVPGLAGMHEGGVIVSFEHWSHDRLNLSVGLLGNCAMLPTALGSRGVRRVGLGEKMLTPVTQN